MRICEINTWPWLSELSELAGRPLTLADVPDRAWDALATFRFDAVWLMGVWHRSPAGRAVAQADRDVRASSAAVCPRFQVSRDVVGSPYSVGAYDVDAALGGNAGLAAARGALARRGLKLVLDFVPNHTGPDHPWIAEHPEYYLPGTEAEREAQPERFFRSAHGEVLAHGAPSPNPAEAWRDTAQLNAFHGGVRDAAVRTLDGIAARCDGIRCDMALLLEGDAFARTWGDRAGPRPAREYWDEVIPAVRARHPSFLWIAEAYAGSEWPLQQRGFDLCYDKDLLYERLARGTARSLLEHLQGAGLDFQRRLLHFIENHDEPPAEEVFRPRERLWMAAVAIATLPGSSLWHAGQLEGRWGRAPVQLGRSVSTRDSYRQLLGVTDRPALREGAWALCPVTHSGSMVAWCWAKGDDRVVVVLNVSEDERTWGHVAVPWSDLAGRRFRLRELLRDEDLGLREGTDLLEGRLYVGPRRWGADVFELTPG